MRRLLSVVTAISILSAQPVLAQQQCTSLTDQSAFEVQALRSELMVLATGCHEDNRYNAFIRRYQSDLQANERAIDAYFKHRYGSSGQTEHDRFVTELANAMSHQGSELGGDFCPRNGVMFNEVLALQSSGDLPNYAAGKDLATGHGGDLHAIAHQPFQNPRDPGEGRCQLQASPTGDLFELSATG